MAKILGVQLAPGVTRKNMIAAWSVGFATTMFVVFIPTMQPYLLSAVLGLPKESQGSVVGLLGTVAEITMVLSLAWYGALADRHGRRPIVVAGFLICALGAVLFPFAGNASVLVALRVLLALGTAALGGMFGTIAIDYATNSSRGKSYGVLGVTTGLGGLLAVFALARLPKLFEAQGLSAADAARASFLTVAVLLVVAGLIMRAGLSKARVSDQSRHIPLTQLIATGTRLARDPGVALAYAAAFVARADLAVVSGFMALWVNHAAQEAGLSEAAALARAGMIVGIAHTMALLVSPLLGWLGDRVKRQNLVIVAQLVAALSYLSTLLVSDPLGPAMIIVACLVGVGEIAGINTAGPLLGQQVPAAVRGSAFGLHSLCGALGIMVVSMLGGWLYDVWIPAAPFVVAGSLGLVVVAFGLVVRNKVVPHPEHEGQEGSANLAKA
ncbi:MFS transporter [Nonomuraea sp. NPDC050310]|uniref:MFS transporter n=1 Tax=Nonomuraea sp. NPDC050310 TaxID=3154935 RepID=UPI0033E920CB